MKSVIKGPSHRASGGIGSVRWLFILVILLILFIPNVSAGALSSAPIVYATTTGALGSASTTHNYTVASQSPSVGDLNIFCTDWNGAPNGNLPGIVTYPMGWALIFTASDGGAGQTQMDCIYKFFVAGDNLTFAVTTTNSIQYAYVGYSITNANVKQRPNDLTFNAGSSANPLASSTTVSPSDNVLVVIAYIWGATGFCTNSAFPANTKNQVVRNNNGASSADSAMATKTEFIGTENPGSATLSASCEWIATSFTIQGIVNSPPELTQETISLLIAAILLFIAGIKWPYFLLMSSVAGTFSAELIFRDLGSVYLAAIVGFSFVISTIVSFAYILRSRGKFA